MRAMLCAAIFAAAAGVISAETLTTDAVNIPVLFHGSWMFSVAPVTCAKEECSPTTYRANITQSDTATGTGPRPCTAVLERQAGSVWVAEGSLDIKYFSNSSGEVYFTTDDGPEQALGMFEFSKASQRHFLSVGPVGSTGQTYVATVTTDAALSITVLRGDKVLSVVTGFWYKVEGNKTLMERYGSILMIGGLIVFQVFVKGYVRKGMANRLPSQKQAMQAVNNAVSSTAADKAVRAKKD